ncbi:MAG: hypothetical protein C4523_16240 [Myxococcales bacterium]|nr:MAG: hypothetical protein C4523_16240 [Myxococcales bacterium]
MNRHPALAGILGAVLFALGCSSGPEPPPPGDEDVDIFGELPVHELLACDRLEFSAAEIGQTQEKPCKLEAVGFPITVFAATFSAETPSSFAIASWKDGQDRELWSADPSQSIVIEPGAPHTLTVRYTAFSTCGERGALLLDTTLADLQIPLAAGAAAGISFSAEPAVLDFGTLVYPDGSSPSLILSVTMRNSGDGALSVNSARLDGAAATPFRFDPAGDCPTPLEIAARGDRACRVEYAPDSSGPHADRLRLGIESGEAGCTGAVELKGDTCTPACSEKECGDDGCGGSCGVCDAGKVCFEFACCTPDCRGKQCGDDLCGGDCGPCPGANDRCEEFLCVCERSCQGRECGDDGCGGSCGACFGSTCRNGRCCLCESGACCDGCFFSPYGESCGDSTYEYRCNGDCGGAVERRTVKEVCSGSSSTCDGITEPGSWVVRRRCDSDELCVEDGASSACLDTDSCCENECQWDERRCDSSQAYQICDNYDDDVCSEWGEPVACPFGSTCSAGTCQ